MFKSVIYNNQLSLTESFPGLTAGQYHQNFLVELRQLAVVNNSYNFIQTYKVIVWWGEALPGFGPVYQGLNHDTQGLDLYIQGLELHTQGLDQFTMDWTSQCT